MLFDTLRKCNSMISSLHVSQMKLGDDCMNQFGEYLKNNKHLVILRINDIGITDKGLEMFAMHLFENTTLKELHLSYNRGITAASLQLLIRMIQSSHIEKLDINITGIDQRNMIAIPLAQNVIKYESNTLYLVGL